MIPAVIDTIMMLHFWPCSFGLETYQAAASFHLALWNECILAYFHCYCRGIRKELTW